MLKVRSLQIVTTNLSYPKDRSAKDTKTRWLRYAVLCYVDGCVYKSGTLSE